MLAAAIETVLARYAFRSFWPDAWRRGVATLRHLADDARKAALAVAGSAAKSGEGPIADLEKITNRRIASIEDLLRLAAESPLAKPADRPARAQLQHSTLRHTAGFAALAVAFLHYYFWDVSLQIASLNSVTVFVAVTPLLEAAT
jgi:hypothetical protein